MVSGEQAIESAQWPRTATVLAHLHGALAPRLDACGEQEMANLLAGLSGRFVPAGPSGAPSRGRPDVLPTGRNFYSVDTRRAHAHRLRHGGAGGRAGDRAPSAGPWAVSGVGGLVGLGHQHHAHRR
ncbi:MAG: cobaltochelatase subunit CobN [Burkholderiaceae bacterium]